MKKTVLILCVLCVIISPIIAQNVQFSSSNIEAGIRRHLGIGETDNITIDQIDSITHLCLSSMSIHDIRDISLLSNIKYLDLSNNLIDNVLPLITLDSLRHLDLSNNNLESISMLSFSYAKEMYVDVTFNYIQDFSLFNTITHCNFAIEGAGLQEKKNAPYFNVYQFYSEMDADSKFKVSYRGYTNMDAGVTLQYVSTNVPVALDGNYNTVEIPDPPQVPTKVILSNGILGDTTYVVPTANFTIGAEKTITLDTGLPEDYYVSSVYATKGLVEIDGKKINYTAPRKPMSDIVSFSYYKGGLLKGFSRYYMNMGKKGDINVNGSVDIQDATLAVNHILGRDNNDDYDYIAADMNGDNTVNVFDVTAIVNVILNGEDNPSHARRLAQEDSYFEPIRFTAEGNGLLFGIDNPERFTSFQFDIEVPEGVELFGVDWNDKTDHMLEFTKNGETRYRVVGLSLSSATLPISTDVLLRLSLSLSETANGDICINNVLFVTPDGKATRFKGTTMGMNTGVIGISSSQGEHIYDTSGHQLNMNRQQLGKGVYIINKKKEIIK